MTEELNHLLTKLPGELASALSELAERYPDLTDIRIRRGRHLAAFSGGENVSSVFTVTPEMMDRTVAALCEQSIYTHMETMKEGYLALEGGVRVGVCGRAILEDGRIAYLDEIGSLNIRLPSAIYHVSGRLYDRIADSDFSVSMLIYSPPGVGKTTLLRDLAVRIAEDGRRRVALIDERRELYTDRMERTDHLDVFLGYPKAKAIEIATRTMSPQYILCDEIGSEEEAWSMLAVQNAGVPILATAHADSVSGLLGRSGIALLHEARMFDYYVGVRRNYNTGRLVFSFCSQQELSG